MTTFGRPAVAALAHRDYGSRLATMRKRRDFLRLRGGVRWSGKAFVLEGKQRSEAGIAGIRFGFTISKKVGAAHERNRMRRRLNHALRLVPVAPQLADWDCVVIARRAALDLPFDDLVRDFTTALTRLASPRPASERKAAHRNEQRKAGP